LTDFTEATVMLAEADRYEPKIIPMNNIVSKLGPVWPGRATTMLDLFPRNYKTFLISN
jgi:hypothetical protein